MEELVKAQHPQWRTNMRKLLNALTILALAFAIQASYAQTSDVEQLRQGHNYEYGIGVKKNIKKAAKFYREAARLFREAAEQGSAGAQNALGYCYKSGKGVKQDYAEAAKWYRLAAEQGLAGAQNNLGDCYNLGKGVQQDYAEAVKWYRLSAEQGYAGAQYNLGLLYDKGQGVQQDYAEAVKYMRLAAKDSQAQEWLDQNKGKVRDADAKLRAEKAAAERAAAEKAAAEKAAAEKAAAERAAAEQRAAEKAAAERAASIAALTGGTGRYVLLSNAVWKDGKSYKIPSGSSVESLFVSGDNVYLAGNSRPQGSSYNRATLWTNGTPQVLDDVASEAAMIYVHNDDVFVLGTRGAGAAKTLALWKNGSLYASNSLSRWTQTPKHMSVSNDNVYIAGRSSDIKFLLFEINSEKSKEFLVKYPYLSYGEYFNFFISGNDVYIATWFYYAPISRQPDKAITNLTGPVLQVYKNDKLLYETNTPDSQHYSFSFSIYVSGGNVYVFQNGAPLRVWKNNELQKFEGFANPESLEQIHTWKDSIFVIGDNSYVFGGRAAYSANGIDYPQAEVIWKNGAAEILSGEWDGPIVSVFVVE